MQEKTKKYLSSIVIGAFSLSLAIVAIGYVVIFYEGPDLEKYNVDKIQIESRDIYQNNDISKGFIHVIPDEYAYLKSLAPSSIYKSNSAVHITVWSFLRKEKGFTLYGSPEYENKYANKKIGQSHINDLLYSFYYVD